MLLQIDVIRCTIKEIKIEGLSTVVFVKNKMKGKKYNPITL